MFNCGSWHSFRKRCNERQRKNVASHLNATCPLDGNENNIAVTGIADDCGTVVTGSSIETLTRLANIDDAIFDEALGLANRKQSTEQ